MLTLQEHLVPYSLHRTHDISMSEISDISQYAAKITLGLNKLFEFIENINNKRCYLHN